MLLRHRKCHAGKQQSCLELPGDGSWLPAGKERPARASNDGVKIKPQTSRFFKSPKKQGKMFLLSSCSASSELKASSECHLGAVWPRQSIFTGENGMLKGKVEQKRKRY